MGIGTAAGWAAAAAVASASASAYGAYDQSQTAKKQLRLSSDMAKVKPEEKSSDMFADDGRKDDLKKQRNILDEDRKKRLQSGGREGTIKKDTTLGSTQLSSKTRLGQ